LYTDLKYFIDNAPLIDTHEHLNKNSEWTEAGPDILQDLFGNYVTADLHTAGASSEAIKALMDPESGDFAERFTGIKPAWEAIQFTGYAEAVSILAHEIYGIKSFNNSELEKAQESLKTWQRPDGRLHLLRDKANIDHVQIDDFCWECFPDDSGQNFFLYDLSWAGFCKGEIDVIPLFKHTNIDVTNLSSLREAMDKLFLLYGPNAIAVKSQHAYSRTLYWQERSDDDAASVLDRLLSGKELDKKERLLLGDWCWARGIELAIKYNLPFKIHTGYYAGNNRMPVDRIRSGNLTSLLSQYTECRFVLMHISYPYSNELIALTKHFRNVWVDLCWAWSIDPYSSTEFVRRFIHTAPINKIFSFGGDTRWPTSALAYSIQARRWLSRALGAEVKDGLLRETQAIEIAERLMFRNQHDCFDIEGTQSNIENT